jgi:uncharacterized membrane protein (Fun14 family)
MFDAFESVMFVSDILTPVMLQLGLGGVGGFLVGYVIKKALKFAVMIGVFTFVLAYFAYESSISVDYEQLISQAEAVTKPIWSMVYPVVSQIPALGSLVLGLLVGFTKG